MPPRDVRAYVHGLEDRLTRALDRFNNCAERREGGAGLWVVNRAGGQGQDRRHRRARDALGDLAWRGVER